MILKHYLISGRVQGVGFRAFTAHQAAGLQLTGWVRNLNDGRVEALIQGPNERQEKLLKVLSKGPTLSEVKEVIAREVSDSDVRFDDFLIASNGDQPWSA